jgi:hypothetical protein
MYPKKQEEARYVVEAGLSPASTIYRVSSLEATSGLEPLMQLLQSRALPLGDVAMMIELIQKQMGIGAGDGIRTRDIFLGKEALYH